MANSYCGVSCGFILANPKIFNPLDTIFLYMSRVSFFFSFFSFLSSFSRAKKTQHCLQNAQVFPIDYIFMVAIFIYFFCATLSGIMRIGIRFLWIHVRRGEKKKKKKKEKNTKQNNKNTRQTFQSLLALQGACQGHRPSGSVVDQHPHDARAPLCERDPAHHLPRLRLVWLSEIREPDPFCPPHLVHSPKHYVAMARCF